MAVCNYINGSFDPDYSLLSYPPADPGTSNTLICRRYHAYLALSLPEAEAETECEAATVGDGVCGTPCQFYCDLMSGACSTSFSSYSACLSACAGYPSNGGEYEDVTGNTIECRLYYAMYATQGTGNATTYCPMAFASTGPCKSSAVHLAVGFVPLLLAFIVHLFV